VTQPDDQAKFQSVLVLYLSDSALDSSVIGWSMYDGTGQSNHYAGEESEPPYASGLQALRDGWRLFQISQLTRPCTGAEYDTSYLRNEFFFERIGSRL
jgi:hypothetical protein